MAGLLALVSPLPYSADFRPYFTIHDPDFQTMASAGVTPDSSNLPRLLGVTNRYFLKVCNADTHLCLELHMLHSQQNPHYSLAVLAYCKVLVRYYGKVLGRGLAL